MPLLLAVTQDPFKENCPAPQIIQSFEEGPVQVWHKGEHGEQVVPLLKLPSGQTVPPDVVDGSASH